ncbi:hypothetical protein AKJ41_01205 [candidate division MSBL1 archaeon SCGC-AAA259O05]|uniref:HTH cro/C1-type domain-containing protein n=1 Tax=candidate division MSBL1 archaeon SCGC-AAA259O05 TaxID=1698271 RepID=A0A133V503_9EURY|nr:hypothetical protein AKJ41_01205 [candidate division MSBL1 archaeon SCGC-AAA259O05]
MKPPCEIAVKKVLPVIRSLLVQDLTQRHDMSQTEIADKLGISQPAVSQYLRSARGANSLEGKLKRKNLYEKILELSDEIGNEEVERPRITKKCCEICKSMIDRPSPD